MALSASLEDYLEAIYEIDKSKRDVHVKDVALKLGVTMPSVNGALKNLEAKGLVTHEKYDHIELTEPGRIQAEKITSRHKMIFLFLSEILKVDGKTAEEDACKTEHVLSRITVEKMAEYLDCTLRTENTGLPPLTVNDLLPGEQGVVKEINTLAHIRQRLMDFGIMEGITVEMVGSAPFGDPVQIKVRDTQLALRRSEAGKLVLEGKGKSHHERKTHRHRSGRKSKQR